MAEVRVGSRELKAHLARYVKIVKEGGTVTLTEWGKPVARIVPLADGEEKPPLEERIKALVRTGRYSWSGEKPEPRQPTATLMGGGMISDLVIEDRRSREDDLYREAFGEDPPAEEQ